MNIDSESKFPEEIRSMLEGLSEMEREVLRMRMGLDRKSPRTFGEVAEQLRLPEEKVEQIEATALEKIRDSGSSR